MNPRQKGRRGAKGRAKPQRADDANAFLPEGAKHANDDLSEMLAEEYLEAATSGEEPDEERMDASVPEEIGGPFVETSAEEELADDVDETNPPDATREPVPRAMGADPTPGHDVEDLNRPNHRTQRR
jgi:hypothetical protein